MDDLLALMEDEEPQEEMEVRAAPRQELKGIPRPTKADVHVRVNQSSSTPTMNTTSSSQQQQQLQRAEGNVDTKLGIRMLQRKIGSIDLLDLICTNPHHSPAALVAMTTASLNNLLQDPSPVIDVATVAGKTHLLTIGIVFNNSGTRISKAGRAFSILQIGTLVTGPIVTVFLFGDAYSQQCKACVPGSVIALVNPNIVPPKDTASSKDTKVSLSVNDGRQLLWVAQARDYGVCRGKTTSKRPDGKLMVYVCKNHVDTRMGVYCKKHSQQANVKNGKTVKDQTFLQKAREEMPRQATMAEMLKGNRPTMLETYLNVQVPNPIQKNPLLSNVPMKMVKGQQLTVQPHQASTLSAKNPYQKKPILQKAPVPVQPRRKPAIEMGFAGQWLQDKSAVKSKPTTKKRTLNLDGATGFNGSVQVPKANKLFRTQMPRQSQLLQQHQISVTETAEEKQQAILERQKSLSRAFVDKTNKNEINIGNRLKLLKKSTVPDSSNTFFAQLSNIDVNAVLNAKSKFETETKAEEYARSRRLVTELEKTEERQQAKEAKKKNQNNKNKPPGKVQREWYCVNCKRTTAIDPKMCKRMNHTIKFKRHIEEKKTVTEKRLQLADKSVEEGGMKLGAGVEWTNFIRKE